MCICSSVGIARSAGQCPAREMSCGQDLAWRMVVYHTRGGHVKYLRAVGFFFGTLGIYLVPPLLGWGIGDLRGFFSLYPRLGYAVLVAVLGLAVVYQAIDAPEGIRGGRGKEDKLIGRQSIVKVVVILAMYGVLVFLPFADRRSEKSIPCG